MVGGGDLFGRFGSRRDVLSIVEGICDSACSEAESRKVRDGSFARAAALVEADILNIVSLAFPGRDCGDPVPLAPAASLRENAHETRDPRAGSDGGRGGGDADESLSSSSFYADSDTDDDDVDNVENDDDPWGEVEQGRGWGDRDYDIAAAGSRRGGPQVWSSLGRWLEGACPGDEPLPCPIDTSARGAIPLVERVVGSARGGGGGGGGEEEESTAAAGAAGAPAGRRRSSAAAAAEHVDPRGRTGVEVPRLDLSSPSSSRGAAKKNRGAQEKRGQHGDRQQRRGQGRARKARSGGDGGVAGSEDRPAREPLSRDDVAMQGKFDAIRARRASERALLRERQRERESLRGREYTFDSDGNPCVVKRVPMERLPQQRVVPRSSVRPTKEEEEERERVKKFGARKAGARKAAADASGRGDVELRALAARAAVEHVREARGAAAGTRRKGGAGKGGAGKGGGSAAFEPHVGWQPPAVDTVPVKPGVTLREGSSARAGPQERPAKNRMSRDEYATMTQSMTQSMTRSMTPSLSATGDAAMRASPAPGALPASQGAGTARDSDDADDPAATRAPARGVARNAAPRVAGGGVVLPKGLHKTKARQPGLNLANRESPFVHSSAPRRVPATPAGSLGATAQGASLASASSRGTRGTKKKYSFKGAHDSANSTIVTPNPELARSLLQERG